MPRILPAPFRSSSARGLRLLRVIAPVILLAIAVRTFVAVPRSVPTESMMPALLPGDLFLALRWPYGAPLASRFGGGIPKRGDIIVVTTPTGDVVKRVIGLPGDRVALRGGTVLLDGAPLARFRVADYSYLETPASQCPTNSATRREQQADGTINCVVHRYREMLPNGRAWDTLASGENVGGDMRRIRVPEDRLFLLGDNRDRSGDSRFAVSAGGLGLVRLDALRGRARFIFWSQDGSAYLAQPASWWRAMRRERIGRTLAER